MKMRWWVVVFCCVLGGVGRAESQEAAPAEPTPSQSSTTAPQPISPMAPPPHVPIAGYGNASFFLRDPHEWFVLFPRARLNVDGYTFLNRGSVPAGVNDNSSADPRPRNTIFIRRARIELQGTIIKHFDFHIAGEFATIPGQGTFGAVTDAFVIADYLSFLKVQAGQFDAPFTLENRTSDKWTDFMERSAAVRAFAVPSNKELGAMIFGWLPKQVVYYSLGVFDGDGLDFRNQDNNPAVIGRAFVAPLAWLSIAQQKHTFLQNIWVGGSLWWQRNNNIGGQALPSVSGTAQDDLPPMTTQGGFAFFSPSFGNGKDEGGNNVRSHLVPHGGTLKWAVEANVPVWSRAGLRFEYIHQSIDLGMYNDTNPMNAQLVRSGPLSGGKLDGSAFYIEAYGWLLGDDRFVETPGLETAPRLRDILVPKPKWAVMIAAKYERVSFDITGLPTSASAMGAVANPAQGHYQLQVFELGVNAWATKHVRLTINYVLNHPDGTSGQIKSNYFFDRNEHELLFRVGLNL